MASSGTPGLPRLWEPHPSLQGELLRRKASLASGLLAAVIPLGVLALFFPEGAFAAPWGGRAITAGVLVGLVAAYLLVRRGSVQAGVIVAIIGIEGGLGASALVAADRLTALLALALLAVPILFAGVVLPVRAATCVAVLTVAYCKVLEARIMGTWFGLPALLLALMLVAVAALAIAASALLQRQMRELDDTARRLREEQGKRIHLLQQLAHDLASPLSPVKLQLHLLRDRLGPDGPRGLAIVQRNVDHLQRLVEDVKDVARLEAGDLRLERRPVDLAALARQAVESLAPAAAERQVGLEVKVDGPDRLAVDADPGRLTQVLYNLVGNGMKFTPGRGRVTVRLTSEDGHAVVGVQDTGAGMRPDQVARLFQPFMQVHDAAAVKRPEDKGSGLGLYISKGIVEAHGGTIEAASDGPGSGTTFTFRLPLAPS